MKTMKIKMTGYFSFCLFIIFIVACGQADKDAIRLDVDFKWNPPCTSSFVSPEITLGKIPDGTTKFYVELTDLDLPAFDHGSGFAKYEGHSTIPAGAVRGSYAGPSPPYGVIHEYEITVKAMNSDNKVLAAGRKALIFPPKGEEELRWQPCEEKGVTNNR